MAGRGPARQHSVGSGHACPSEDPGDLPPNQDTSQVRTHGNFWGSSPAMLSLGQLRPRLSDPGLTVCLANSGLRFLFFPLGLVYCTQRNFSLAKHARIRLGELVGLEASPPAKNLVLEGSMDG